MSASRSRLPRKTDADEALELARLKVRPAKPLRPAPKSIGTFATRQLKDALEQAGPSLTRLESQWAEIVGHKLAAVTKPGKMVQTPRGRMLTVHCAPAAAPIVDHMSEALRKRISLSAGGDIVGLRIEQGLPSPRPKAGDKPARELTADERAAIEADAARFDDPRLRAAIVALATAVLTRQG